jgi:hypothetical protein
MNIFADVIFRLENIFMVTKKCLVIQHLVNKKGLMYLNLQVVFGVERNPDMSVATNGLG